MCSIDGNQFWDVPVEIVEALVGGVLHERTEQSVVTHVDHPGEIEAQLNYLAPIPERPRTYTFPAPPGSQQTNVVPEAHRVTIRNARPSADTFRLDSHGFAILRTPSAITEFDDEVAIRTTYYAEADRLLKEATGADRVFIFDHTIRRHVPGAKDYEEGPRQPATRVHVDHTARSGPQRVRDLLPNEAEQLLRGRVQVINLWRPIRHPVYDAPLAVCDATTVQPDELIPSDLVYPHRVGETYNVRFGETHRWYYLPEMQPDEVLLLKCTDSRADIPARFTPHTAFLDETAPSGAPRRESIELRALVFHSA
jgi:hypothetical protein